jgi:hypothetical protein
MVFTEFFPRLFACTLAHSYSNRIKSYSVHQHMSTRQYGTFIANVADKFCFCNKLKELSFDNFREVFAKIFMKIVAIR